jgi:hypothetical protein
MVPVSAYAAVNRGYRRAAAGAAPGCSTDEPSQWLTRSASSTTWRFWPAGRPQPRDLPEYLLADILGYGGGLPAHRHGDVGH